MGSLQVKPSAEAETDLSLQSAWYAEHAGMDIAERYLAAFATRLELLRCMPMLGRVRKFRHQKLAGLRSIIFGGKFYNHIIFFRIEGDVLQVFRVIHGARDLPRRLLQPPGSED